MERGSSVKRLDNSAPTSRKGHSMSVEKTKQLMPFSRTVEVYCENDGEDSSTVCNTKLLDVECGDIFYYMELRGPRVDTASFLACSHLQACSQLRNPNIPQYRYTA